MSRIVAIERASCLNILVTRASRLLVNGTTECFLLAYMPFELELAPFMVIPSRAMY